MQNVYMTPLSYENFAGIKKTTKLYFHITPREFVDWMLEEREKADKLIADFMSVRGDMDDENTAFSTEDTRVLLRMVKVLSELSYGVPSDDGEIFDKSGLQRFIHSAAYDAFRMFLFENPNELEQFFKQLLNEDIVKAFGDRMAKLQQEAIENQQDIEAIKQVEAGFKDPKDMSREELLAAMQNKMQTPAVIPPGA